jgi:hypothetical protein
MFAVRKFQHASFFPRATHLRDALRYGKRLERIRSGPAFPACLLLAFTGLSGCVSPLVTRTASFASAGAPAITATRDAYALVQTVQAGEATAQRLQEWDTTSIDAPPPAATFGTPEDLKARDEVLGLLSGYVADLAEVSGSKSLDAIDTASKDSGAAMGKLANDSLLASGQGKATAPALTTPELQAASAAIDALDRLLVARARRRALPRILAEADGPVTTLCTTLRSDFGTPTTPGLRNAVQTNYEHWITIDDASIRIHAKEFSYPEKRAAIEDVFALQIKEREADATLARADDALAKFAAAHHALALSAAHGDAVSFHELLGELIVQAQQLSALEKNDAGTTSTKKATP